MAPNRSPNYPAISLPEAVELATKLYQREGRSPVDAERAALALGYNSLSGASRTKLSGLRKFELVEDTGNGIRVSDLTMTLLHPDSPEEKRSALLRAATAPALFRDLAELPGASNENLISRLVRQGFTEAGAKLAVAAFRKTMSLVTDEASGYDQGHDESEPLLAPGSTVALRGRSGSQVSTNRGSGMRIPLPGGLAAELRLPDPITPEAIKYVVDWLGLAPKVPDEPVESQTSPRTELATTAPEPLAEQSQNDAPD
jgi:hypothetical protein